LKRAFDFVASAVLLILLAPVMAVVAICVRIRLGSPVLFRQLRPGLLGRPFTLYKFRTMRNAPDGEAGVASDRLRLTPFGSWLRATSLDELPELWNVLRGEMSLVGPRPLLMQYLERYSPEQMRRHEVRPGITGWAQVNGRNALGWDEKLRLDTWYVDHRNLLLDLKIIFMTAAALLKNEGIAHDNSATMPEFTGSKARRSEKDENDQTLDQ
jgi:lipopolysaccharide/colanic/teichoic acid biosynthesis glycosyltransferase